MSKEFLISQKIIKKIYEKFKIENMREDKKEIYDKFKIQNLKEEIKGLLDLSNEDILEYLGIESIDE